LLAAGFTASAAQGGLTHEHALDAFRLEPGLQIQLIAAEPVVVAPVAMTFDEKGRMFVVENRGYPTGPGPGAPPAGVIALLEDTDGDGRFDKRTVFADGLTFPNGIMPWKGGFFVTCAPEVLYLKDTDGDGRADVRKVVFTGFSTSGSTQLRVSHPTLGLDGWVYLTSGLTGGKVTSPDYPSHPPVELKTDFRFRPDTDQFEAADGRAQFGMSFDDFGNRFICMNRVQAQHVVLPSRYLRRNPHLIFSGVVQNLPEETVPEPLKGHLAAARVYAISHNITTADSHAGTFTAACGVMVYRARELPKEDWGNIFSCEPTGNLVHRDQLIPSGATFVARRSAEKVEFVASPDDWFRPVFLSTGPDGAIYICDMYRKTIEHPDYLPDEVRKHTDFESGKDKGRIYRVSRTGSRTMKQKWLDHASARELCQQFENPNAWWRETAQRLILERKEMATVPLLNKALRSRHSAVQALHALYTLEGLGRLDEEQIRHALADSNPAVREHAIVLAERHLPKSASTVSLLLPLAKDPEPRIRFQCALSLGEFDDPRAIPALAKIAECDASDRWARAAVLSSVGMRAPELWRALVQDEGHDGSHPERLNVFASELGRIIGAGQPKEALPDLLRELTAQRSDKDVPDAQFSLTLAVVSGFAEGVRNRGIGTPTRSALTSLLDGESPDAKQTRETVATLFRKAASIIADPRASLGLQVSAAGLLAQADFFLAGDGLLKLLRNQQPLELQRAAVRSLALMPGTEAASAMIMAERWQAYTPPIREAILSALLSQPRHLPALLSALEGGALPGSAVDSARRTQLMQNRDPSIAARAEALFKNIQGGDRKKVFEDYKSVVAHAANAKNGREIFKKNCASCHRLDREGIAVGPDLFGIRNQPKEVILLHIIIPEYEIMPGFVNYVIETRDGRTLSGIIGGETDSKVTLRRALGEEETVDRANILSLTSTGLSLMPQELEKNMSRQDMADLIAYLKGEAE
jgi:putative membrane-bound dehydrogenase-like protein